MRHSRITERIPSKGRPSAFGNECAPSDKRSKHSRQPGRPETSVNCSVAEVGQLIEDARAAELLRNRLLRVREKAVARVRAREDDLDRIEHVA